MKVAIVGYGIEGKLNYGYWKTQGADITICDENPGADVPGRHPVHQTALAPAQPSLDRRTESASSDA